MQSITTQKKEIWAYYKQVEKFYQIVNVAIPADYSVKMKEKNI